jgi:hypothetical protein
MDHREAFRSPLKQASDPGSRFGAAVFVGIVCAGATASSRQIASPISLGMRSAVDLGIGVGHSRRTYLICDFCAIIAPGGALASSRDGTRLPHLLRQLIRGAAASARSRNPSYGNNHSRESVPMALTMFADRWQGDLGPRSASGPILSKAQGPTEALCQWTKSLPR